MFRKAVRFLDAFTSFDKAKNALRSGKNVSINLDPESFSAINPIHSIENGFIFSVDGMVYKGFVLSEPYYGVIDESGYDEFSEALQLSYNELPVGSCVHRHIPFNNVYFNESSKDFDLDYSRYFDYSRKVKMIEKPIMAHKSILLLGVSANKELSTVKLSSMNNLFVGKGTNFKDPYQNLEQVIEKYDEIASRFFSRLEYLGIKRKELNNEELDSLTKKYLNLDYTANGGKQLQVNYASKFPYFQAGNKLVGVVSFGGNLQEVKSSQKNFYGVESAFNYSLYYNLNFPHIVNQYIFIRDQNTVMAELEEKQSMFGKDDVVGVDMGDYLNEIKSSGDRLIEFGTNIICYSTKAVELEHFMEETVSALQSMGKCTAQKEVVEDAANIFFSSIPGAIHSNYRRYTYPSLYAACMTTFPGQYYPKGNYIVRGRDERPVLIGTQPDDPKASNNSVTVGPTGGGKSVFTFVMMGHYLEKGDEVMIIDKGKSHTNLAKMYDMAYYDFTDLEKVDLNFYRTQTDDFGKYVLSDAAKSSIVSNFRILWKSDEGGVLKTVQLSCLEALIDMFYEKINRSGDDLNHDSFLRHLRDTKPNDITDRLDIGNMDLVKYFDKDELLLALSRYSSRVNGYRGKVFNQPNTGYFKKGISSVYELSNIAQDPELYSLFTVSLSNVILQGVYNRRHIRKHVVYDESSEALPGDQGSLLKLLFREIRKENGDVNIIVQLITDITKNSNGEVILDNAINKYLLDHRMATNTMPVVKEALKLTEHQYEIFKSLNKRPSPTRREFMLHRPDMCGAYALELPEDLRLVASTDPADQKVLSELLKRHTNVSIALKEYMESLKLTK